MAAWMFEMNLPETQDKVPYLPNLSFREVYDSQSTRLSLPGDTLKVDASRTPGSFLWKQLVLAARTDLVDASHSN